MDIDTNTNVTCEMTLNCDESDESCIKDMTTVTVRKQTSSSRNNKPIWDGLDLCLSLSSDKETPTRKYKSSYKVNTHNVLRSSFHNCAFGSQRSRVCSDIFVVIVVYFYRPQTKFAKVMFLHLSVNHSVHGGGAVPGQVHPPGRYTTLGRYTPPPPEVHPPSWQVHPPPVRYPRPQCMLGYGQQAGSTHSTGSHSC